MKKLLFILAVVLWASQACSAPDSTSGNGTTYYIDPTCSTSGNGKTTTCGANGPFKTWEKVTWAAGNTYSQKGGTTYYGTITVGASGTAANPITINSYGTGKAILNGGIKVDPSAWTANDPVPGVYSKSWSTYYNYPKLEDGIFMDEASKTSCTDGNYTRPWVAGGKKNYYKPTSGKPSDHTFEEIRFVGINLVNHDYITITGFSFTKFRSCILGYDFPKDMGVANSHITITNNAFSNSVFGVGLGCRGANSSNNVITHNTFDYIRSSVELFAYGGCDAGTTIGNNSSMEVSHNTITHCAQIYTPSGPAGYDWEAADLTAGGAEDKEGIGTQDLINSSIHHNTITGTCRGIFMFTCARKDTHSNDIYNNHIGTTRVPLIMYPDTGTIGAKSQYGNNIFYNVMAGGVNDGYYSAIVVKNTKTASSIPNNIYNNTFYSTINGITLLSPTDYFTIKNNIFHGTRNYPVVQQGSGSNIIYDYNLYNTPANGFYISGVAKSWLEWRASGKDVNSPRPSDPLFTNAAGGVYTLTAKSPARGKGVNVGLTTDIAGRPVNNPPSIGAYEYIEADDHSTAPSK